MIYPKRSSKPLNVAYLLGLTACTQASSGAPLPSIDPVAIVVDCDDSANNDPQTWLCPESITVDCADDPDTIRVVVRSPTSIRCSAEQLSAVVSDPWTSGRHEVVVRDRSGTALCSTEVTVVSTATPALVSHTLQMWPPNHKFHDFAVGDCVSATDSCGSQLQGEFIWASSDEPVDALGDGHHAPDILLSDDCQHVSLRSERQGPEDGRVYKLGVRLVDRAGNVSEAECAVVVAHDQSGVAGADSGEAYRVVFDGTGDGPVCDGEPPPHEPPPPPVSKAPAPE
jgi:hypothetical protein